MIPGFIFWEHAGAMVKYVTCIPLAILISRTPVEILTWQAGSVNWGLGSGALLRDETKYQKKASEVFEWGRGRGRILILLGVSLWSPTGLAAFAGTFKTLLSCSMAVVGVGGITAAHSLLGHCGWLLRTKMFRRRKRGSSAWHVAKLLVLSAASVDCGVKRRQMIVAHN